MQPCVRCTSCTRTPSPSAPGKSPEINGTTAWVLPVAPARRWHCASGAARVRGVAPPNHRITTLTPPLSLPFPRGPRRQRYGRRERAGTSADSTFEESSLGGPPHLQLRLEMRKCSSEANASESFDSREPGRARRAVCGQYPPALGPVGGALLGAILCEVDLPRWTWRWRKLNSSSSHTHTAQPHTTDPTAISTRHQTINGIIRLCISADSRTCFSTVFGQLGCYASPKKKLNSSFVHPVGDHQATTPAGVHWWTNHQCELPKTGIYTPEGKSKPHGSTWP